MGGQQVGDEIILLFLFLLDLESFPEVPEVLVVVLIGELNQNEVGDNHGENRVFESGLLAELDLHKPRAHIENKNGEILQKGEQG